MPYAIRPMLVKATRRITPLRMMPLLMAALLCLAAVCAGQAEKPYDFSAMDAAIAEAVEHGVIPGAVVLVGHDGQVVHRRAIGRREVEPESEAMTADTIFDLASLTKCVATGVAMTQLIEEGKVGLDDPVAKYLPEFGANGKEAVTIRELLTHTSGLREDLDLSFEWTGRGTAYRMAMAERPMRVPGSHFAYSDINYIVLGFVVEKLSGLSLDEYATRRIFAPLGMTETRYLPPAEWRARIAPTDRDEHGNWLRGVVHDPTTQRMGGVAGHAGVFSTVDDLAKFAEEMLGAGRLLTPAALRLMTSPQQPKTLAGDVQRGLGWDIHSAFSAPRGELFGATSFGHTGFTGTSIWIDPASHSYVILLSNALHPNGKRIPGALRARVSTEAARALGVGQAAADEAKPQVAAVRTGIEVLKAHGFAELRRPGREVTRVALVTNQTGVDEAGARDIDLIAHAEGLKLTAIFTPEHGLAGQLDTTSVGDGRDGATNVPVYSVYGATDAKRRPRAEVLAGVDVIAFDIADAGVHFYTYETTLGYFLEAAAKANVPIVVLDRPNPVSGRLVQGPVSDAGREDFTNYGAVPVRHGMTMGELAGYYNGERAIGARLAVVKMEGWRRDEWMDATGLRWVNPSPNLRSLTEAALYPGVGMIEMTNVSVGRGTETPFEVVGAPWVKGAELAQKLTARGIPGVTFAATEFTPASATYAHQACQGVRITVTDREALDAVEMGLEVAAALHELYPTKYELKGLDRLMVNRQSAAELAAGVDPREIARGWQAALAEFEKRREKYLLY